jgi:hypothetical protein
VQEVPQRLEVIPMLVHGFMEFGREAPILDVDFIEILAKDGLKINPRLSVVIA